MQIILNDKNVEVAEMETLFSLSQSQKWPEAGLAVAVNNKIVQRAEWKSFQLKASDRIVLVKAACGG